MKPSVQFIEKNTEKDECLQDDDDYEEYPVLYCSVRRQGDDYNQQSSTIYSHKYEQQQSKARTRYWVN